MHKLLRSKCVLNCNYAQTSGMDCIAALTLSNDVPYDLVIRTEKGGKVPNFLLSLDEIDRVMRLHHIVSKVELAERTQLSRNTWNAALKSRKPTPDTLNALARLGARPGRVLVLDEGAASQPAAA
ncbi:helix-turn-helix domain-containing protein [Corynebacterium mastitidis]